MDLILEVVEGSTLQLTQANAAIELVEASAPSITVSQPAQGTLIEVMAGLKGDKGDSGDATSTDWAAIQNKPLTFPPSAHNHDERYYTESEIDTMFSNVDTGPVDWTDVENKPATFAPSAHGHDAADISSGTLPTTRGGTGTNSLTGLRFLTSSSDGSSVTTTKGIPTGLVVGTTDVQTLTNKTITAPLGLVKADVGLNNVDNTSDASKPVSTAQASAIAAKVSLSGAETIAGVKTFSSAPVVPDGSFSIASTSGLQTALDGKSATGHSHVSGDITDFTSSIQSIVNTQLDIAGAPGTLDTINELAAALGDDPNFSATVMNQLALKAADNAVVHLAGTETITGAKNFTATPAFNAGVSMGDAQNINLQTTTGTKIGTATTQKLGFFNATPIVQPNNSTDLGTVLSNLGLRAAGTAYPITTSASVGLSGQVSLTQNVRFNVLTSTANVSITTSSVPHHHVNATSGPLNATLPAITTAGYFYTIKKIDSSANTVTVVATDIDGATNYVLSNQWDYVTVVSTATSGSWRIVASNRVGVHTHTKADVGLANVDNTSDVNKPISTATQTALDGKANTSHTHAAADITSGILATARLGSGTANSTTYLRGDGTWATVATGTSGVSSVNTRTGDVTLTKSDVGLANVDNTSDANKPVSTATQNALDAKAVTPVTGTKSVWQFKFTDATVARPNVPPYVSVNWVGPAGTGGAPPSNMANDDSWDMTP